MLVFLVNDSCFFCLRFQPENRWPVKNKTIFSPMNIKMHEARDIDEREQV